MLNKKTLLYLCQILISIIAIYVLSWAYHKIELQIQIHGAMTVGSPKSINNILQLYISSLLLGILLEIHKLFNQKTKPHLLLVPTILLGIIGFSPFYYWGFHFGINITPQNFITLPVRYILVHAVLLLITGILFIRSLIRSE